MATVDLRCGTTLHGRLTDERWLEVKCKRRACGFVKGTVVLHTIDITTGKVVKTDTFAEPSTQNRRGHNASHHARSSVRTA
jgi:hypothetical protein